MGLAHRKTENNSVVSEPRDHDIELTYFENESLPTQSTLANKWIIGQYYRLFSAHHRQKHHPGVYGIYSQRHRTFD